MSKTAQVVKWDAVTSNWTHELVDIAPSVREHS